MTDSKVDSVEPTTKIQTVTLAGKPVKAFWITASPPRIAFISEFKGVKYMNMRECFYNDQHELMPTKKGMNVPLNVFHDFLGCVDELEMA